jgi:hypothetical protein
VNKIQEEKAIEETFKKMEGTLKLLIFILKVLKEMGEQV